jgi:hypothetical protein
MHVDLLFHTPEVLDKIRECAGAIWKEDHFVFTTETMKKGEYYGMSVLSSSPFSLSLNRI